MKVEVMFWHYDSIQIPDVLLRNSLFSSNQECLANQLLFNSNVR